MKNKTKLMDEYEEFIQADDLEIPQEIKSHVFNRIQKLIHPHAHNVFFKILGIHVIVGFLSLSICHQFGINPFNTDRSLDRFMMSVGGHQFCMFGCGVLFVSLSLAAAGYFLTFEEIKALKRTQFLQTLSLGLISLGLLAFFGAELLVSFAAIWLSGALIGGFLTTETMWRLKNA